MLHNEGLYSTDEETGLAVVIAMNGALVYNIYA